jgi:hypothetical protein
VGPRVTKQTEGRPARVIDAGLTPAARTFLQFALFCVRTPLPFPRLREGVGKAAGGGLGGWEAVPWRTA